MDKSASEFLVAGQSAAAADSLAYNPAANIDSPAAIYSFSCCPTANTKSLAVDDIGSVDPIIADSPAADNQAALDLIIDSRVGDSPAAGESVMDSILGDSPAALNSVADGPADDECASHNPANDGVEENSSANDDINDDPAVFPLRKLPEEIQDLILIDIAVSWRIATGSFEKVYTALAPVCKRWQAVISKPKFFDEVKACVFKLDGTARYRRKSQRVQIEGIDQYQAGIECAVILNQKLYLIESFEFTTPLRSNYHIFVYDLDFSDYNHTEVTKRRVICSDRRELVIEGQDNRPELLVSSPAKNCLYFLATGSIAQGSEDYRQRVYSVSPDGAVSYYLNAGSYVRNMSTDKSGEHLVIYNGGQISVYSTRTMQITSTLKLDFFHNPPSSGEQFRMPCTKGLCFLSAVLRDDLSLMACIRETLSTVYVVLCTPTADGKSYEKYSERYYMYEYEFSLAADDNLCTMLMGSELHVSGRLLERARKMNCLLEIVGVNFPTGYSYDRRYGLVLGIYDGKLTMIRVTI